MKGRTKHGFLCDEQGDLSFSRLALAIVIPVSICLLVADAAGHALTEAGYAYMTKLVVTLGVWAGMRASARYLQRKPPSPITPETE